MAGAALMLLLRPEDSHRPRAWSSTLSRPVCVHYPTAPVLLNNKQETVNMESHTISWEQNSCWGGPYVSELAEWLPLMQHCGRLRTLHTEQGRQAEGT